jgi:hypothetical protein
MARMFPPSILDDHGSPAERRIFRALRDQTPRDWAVIHSVGLTSHAHKQWAETDFVAIVPSGVFCLEVKGGRIRHEDGCWYTNDQPLRESPFAQAGGNTAALRHYLDDRGTLSGRRPLVGYGVLFPDVVFDQHLPEADAELVYDARDSSMPIERYVQQVATHWQDWSAEHRGYVPEPLSRGDVSKVLHELAPDFELVPSLSAVLHEVEDELIRLTDQQVELLEGLRESPRVVVRGGAGTGKTLVACHEAARLAKAGFHTTYVCYGSRLAHEVRSVLEPLGVEVAHAHGLMASLIREADLSGSLPDVQTEDLMDIYYPQVALDALTALDRLGAVDALVLDEAQDILKEPVVLFFDGLLRGELSGGTWRLFLDPNQNLFAGGEAAGMDELEARAVAYRLRRNCRNTRQIAVATSILSGTPVSETMSAEGPDVVEAWYSDKRTFQRETNRVLNEWLARGISAEDVVILAPRALRNSMLADVRLPRALVDVGSGAEPRSGSFQFSTIQGFKGLEAEVVLLTEFEDLDRSDAAALLYVGASRAKALLGVVLDERIKPQYADRAADLVLRLTHA